MRIGDIVKRVYRESFSDQDTVHKVERFNPTGTKAVLKMYRSDKPVGKAVTVKLDNIKGGMQNGGCFVSDIDIRIGPWYRDHD